MKLNWYEIGDVEKNKPKLFDKMVNVYKAHYAKGDYECNVLVLNPDEFDGMSEEATRAEIDTMLQAKHPGVSFNTITSKNFVIIHLGKDQTKVAENVSNIAVQEAQKKDETEKALCCTRVTNNGQGAVNFVLADRSTGLLTLFAAWRDKAQEAQPTPPPIPATPPSFNLVVEKKQSCCEKIFGCISRLFDYSKYDHKVSVGRANKWVYGSTALAGGATAAGLGFGLYSDALAGKSDPNIDVLTNGLKGDDVDMERWHLVVAAAVITMLIALATATVVLRCKGEAKGIDSF